MNYLQVEKGKSVGIGDIIMVEEGNTLILAQVSLKMVAAIGLDDGDRWLEAVRVENVHDISNSEMNAILDGSKYTLVHSVLITRE